MDHIPTSPAEDGKRGKLLERAVKVLFDNRGRRDAEGRVVIAFEGIDDRVFVIPGPIPEPGKSDVAPHATLVLRGILYGSIESVRDDLLGVLMRSPLVIPLTLESLMRP